jgi:hypothetical protein
VDALDRLLLELEESPRGQHAVAAGPRQVDRDELLHAAGSCGHDHHEVAEEDRLLQIVGDEEDGLVREVVQLEQVLVHHGLRERVEGAERLVEEQDLRVVDERAHDLHTPPHARGDLARVLALDVGQAYLAHERARVRLGLPARHAPLHHRPVGHIVEHRLPRKERALLEHHDAVRAGLEIPPGSGDDVPVEGDLARGEAVEAGDGVEQGGLATTRWPHHDTDAARAHLERAVLDGDDVDALGIVDLARAADAEAAGPRGHEPLRLRHHPGEPLHHRIAAGRLELQDLTQARAGQSEHGRVLQALHREHAAPHVLHHRGETEDFPGTPHHALGRVLTAEQARVADRATGEDVEVVGRLAHAIDHGPARKPAFLGGGGDGGQHGVGHVLEQLHRAERRGDVGHQIDSPDFAFQASMRRWSTRSPTPMSRPMKPMLNMAMRRVGVDTLM